MNAAMSLNDDLLSRCTSSWNVIRNEWVADSDTV